MYKGVNCVLRFGGGGLPSFSYEQGLVNHIPASGGELLSSSVHAPSDGCALYKVAFNQDQYYQYLQFKEELPDLKEFTLCMWTKFNNHSSDHPLFSYVGEFTFKFVTE